MSPVLQRAWYYPSGKYTIPMLVYSINPCLWSFSILLLQVQAIYRDPSIGNSINIIVVRIEILRNETVSWTSICYSSY